MRAKFVVAALMIWLGAAGAVSASADQVVLEPGDVLRATFDLQPVAYAPLESYDVFLFTPGVIAVDPISSFTARLFDHGQLLGTYTSTDNWALPGRFPIAAFKGATSTYTRGNPTVIDFSSFQDRTFDGSVEFTIASGSANVFRTSDELEIGYAFTPAIETGSGFSPKTFEVVSGSATPEPSTILLLVTGVGAIGARRRSARRR